jgi:hypothetical protein
MENPPNEIAYVVGLLCSSASPDAQQAAFLKYVVPDVGFKHPLCAVEPGRDSRSQLLGIYQWYKVMSPRIDIRVDEVCEYLPIDATAYGLGNVLRMEIHGVLSL